MGHYDSFMIGIRTGGVFAADLDEAEWEDLRDRIFAVCEELQSEYLHGNLSRKDSLPLSKELVGWKGGYVVLAGIGNYFDAWKSTELARVLSERLKAEVMHMNWCEDGDNSIHADVFYDGKPVGRASIGDAIRRVAG